MKAAIVVWFHLNVLASQSISSVKSMTFSDLLRAANHSIADGSFASPHSTAVPLTNAGT